MSIIQEALKKAQTTYARKTVPVADKTIPKDPVDAGLAAPQPETKSRSAVMPFTKLMPAVALILIVIGFCLISFVSNKFAQSPRSDAHQDVSYKPTVKDIPAAEMPIRNFGINAQDLATPIKSNFSAGPAFIGAPELTLNGIMYLQERPRAIINGSMIGEGDFLEGYTVTKIDETSVQLRSNKAEITLRLK